MPYSLAQKTLQLLFPELRFGVTDPAAAEWLVDLGVGGFCVYGGTAAEIAATTRRLQKRARIPLLFCADYEDGLASHLPEGTRFPSNMGLGAAGSQKWAYEKGRLTAIEARAIGIRWVLAPVLDLATEPANPIVNIRSFGAEPAQVSRLGAAMMRGLRAGGALSCAKHFPGHGETTVDSHLALPVLRLSRSHLAAHDLVPFRRTKSLADSVMAAHLKFPALGDARRLPASLSRTVLDGLLRRGLHYAGLISTDALSMNAIAKHFKEERACAAALRAGADVLLVPVDAAQAAVALPDLVAGDRALTRQVERAFGRLLKAKRDCGSFRDLGVRPESELALVGCSRHRQTAERMARACLSWARRPKRELARHVGYLELGVATPDQWKGKPFVEALKARGVHVEPYRQGLPALVVNFLRPTAYSGKIRIDPAERGPVQEAIRSTPGAALVSFANPFVMDEFDGYDAGLCAFSPMEESQRATADALLGRFRPTGRMPVTLRSALNSRR